MGKEGRLLRCQIEATGSLFRKNKIPQEDLMYRSITWGWSVCGKIAVQSHRFVRNVDTSVYNLSGKKERWYRENCQDLQCKLSSRSVCMLMCLRKLTEASKPLLSSVNIYTQLQKHPCVFKSGKNHSFVA